MNISVLNKVKTYPAPIGSNTPQITWNPNKVHSSDPVICRDCQEGNLYWSWNFQLRKPCLVKDGYVHRCPTPSTRDVFPGWCETCKAPDLLWLRKQSGFVLEENYGLPHACEQDPTKAIQDMKDASCKFCKTTGLFWVTVNAKYVLTHPDGTKHSCSFYTPYMKDWAEAKRMNYAVEKAWLKSIPHDTPCRKCKGKGHVEFLSKNKRTMQKYRSSEPILMHRPCMKCKRIGMFSVEKKKEYLKELRKKYWPFKGGTHKWKQYDGS